MKQKRKMNPIMKKEMMVSARSVKMSIASENEIIPTNALIAKILPKTLYAIANKPIFRIKYIIDDEKNFIPIEWSKVLIIIARPENPPVDILLGSKNNEKAKPIINVPKIIIAKSNTICHLLFTRINIYHLKIQYIVNHS